MEIDALLQCIIL